MHSFLLASVTPSTWLWYVSFALSHHVYFLLVAFNLNIVRILFLFAMLLVSLLPALLLSSKLKFYLLQSPYFPSLPLFLLCLSLSPLKFLLISSPSSQWKLLCFYFFLSEIYLSHVGVNFSFIILELVSVLLCVSPSLFWLWRGQHTYMATPGALKKKCRQYSVEYLKYGFIQSPTNPQPMCLVCKKNFSNETMKPSRLLEHLQKIHPDKSGKTLAFFIVFEINFWSEKQ